MRATLIRMTGPGQEAVLEIKGRQYRVRDGFSWDAAHMPHVGHDFDVSLSAEIDRSWSWEKVFAANPDQRVGLLPMERWAYVGMGRITSIDPVRVDCGVLVAEDVIHSRDPRIIGEFVGFGIEVLDAR